MSRRKGASAEREFRDLLRLWGFNASRGQPPFGDVVHDVPGVHFEVKRQETLALPAWTRQAEADARPGEVPVVAYRRSREPWRVSMSASEFLRLKRLEVELCECTDRTTSRSS